MPAKFHESFLTYAQILVYIPQNYQRIFKVLKRICRDILITFFSTKYGDLFSLVSFILYYCNIVVNKGIQ